MLGMKHEAEVEAWRCKIVGGFSARSFQGLVIFNRYMGISLGPPYSSQNCTKGMTSLVLRIKDLCCCSNSVWIGALGKLMDKLIDNLVDMLTTKPFYKKSLTSSASMLCFEV